jgi:hypothetical protein
LRPPQCSLPDSAQELIALCRNDIVKARIQLAAEQALTAAQQRDLWCVVDCRERLLKMLAKDFDAELEQIDRELENELRRR